MVVMDAALWWLPTVAVALVTVLGVFAAASSPPEGRGRSYRVAVVLLVGALAIAASAWQQARSRAMLGEETARLRELATRLDDVAGLLPAGPGKTPGETFDTVAAALRSLNAKIEDLEAQIQALKEEARGRTIAPDTAAKMAEHLRPYGSQRVVVSCVPDDVEAFNYANRIAGVLREAGWDALGPEKTTIFGAAPGMGLRLFVRAGMAPPKAAKILLDAFARFNIPFQSGIAPSDAIPDPATVEIFVSRKS